MPEFDPSGLDRVIHSPVRLAAVAALHSGGEATFTDLKKLTGTTDGNLTVHMQVLEQNGIIKVRKRFIGRRPQTSYQLTGKGRTIFQNYVAQMALMVKAYSGGAERG